MEDDAMCTWKDEKHTDEWKDLSSPEKNNLERLTVENQAIEAAEFLQTAGIVWNSYWEGKNKLIESLPKQLPDPW